MPSIRDFSSGVVNQELQNRDQGAGILFDCKNVLSSWNGELRKRSGTAFLQQLPEHGVIIPYRMPDGDDIILLATDGQIAGYKFVGDHSVSTFDTFSGDAPEFPTTGWEGYITNGDFTIGLSSGTTQDLWGKGFDEPDLGRPQKYYNKGSKWVNGYGTEAYTPQTIEISTEDDNILNSVRIHWLNSCSGNRPGHYKGFLEPIIQYSDDDINWTSVQTEIKNPYVSGGEIYQASYHYSDRTECKTIYEVINVGHTEAHKYWRIRFASRIPNTTTYSGERLELFVSNVKYLPTTSTPLVEQNSFFTSDNLENIKYTQNNSLMILTNGTDAPLKIEYSAGSFTIETFTTTLSADQGYPTCCCFYQNRLWFGGFTAFPTRVWGSGFGNFADFTIPSTVLATSPISADSVEIKSIIENLWGGNNALYCLSADGISMIDAQGGIVATNQIEFKLRNREPVDAMTPTYKDDIMVYLGRNRQKILITDFDFVVQRFRAQNISLSYDNWLTDGIKELHYIPNKASLIYGLLTNGKGFALLFDVTTNKNAIFPLEIDGEIRDIQPIKHSDYTALVLITQRNGQYYMEEKLQQPDYAIMDFMSEAEKIAYTKTTTLSTIGYLDCMTKYEFAEPVDEISDVPYSFTDKVDAIIDGLYQQNIDVLPSISTGLYAWKSEENKIFYTNSETPSIGDNVFNNNQIILSDCDITDVTENSIDVHTEEQEEVTYLGYGTRDYIAVSLILVKFETGAYLDVNASRDINADYISGGVKYYAWKIDREISTTEENPDVLYYSYAYTKNPIPTTSDYIRFDYEKRAGNPGHIEKFTGVSPAIKRFVVGNSVYDESLNLLGTATFVDENTCVYNNKTYFRWADIDQRHIGPKEYTYTCLRSEDDDIAVRSATIKLPFEAKEVIFGCPYESYAVIKFVSPYNMRKFPKEISVNFINSGYLEVGNTFDSLKPCLNNLIDSVIISGEKIFMNGNYTKTFDKQTFETPYVIVRSDKGLPFMITGIDYKVDMSNYQGGV